MPTYREDLHSGHKVPLIETDDLLDLCVTTEKLSDKAVTAEKIADGAVTTEKLAPEAIEDLTGLEGEVQQFLDQSEYEFHIWKEDASDKVDACERATKAANEAASGASNVNAELDGYMLTVTNRDGESVTENVRGPQGFPGRPGLRGPAGASAYQVAVEEGFEGTEEEWLESLEGEPGTTDYNELENKPDLSIYQEKEQGKGLSENDYTDEEKQLVHSAVQQESDPTVPQWAKQPNKPTYTAQEVGALPADTHIPSTTAELTNDAGFITNTVNNLVNYYLKSETYTKTEVQTLIDTIKQFTYEVVQTLPTASTQTMHKIYLTPSSDPQTQNVKDEFITIDNGQEAQTRYTWEQIGSTAIDLSGYYTSAQTDAAITAALNTALADYTTTANLTTLLAAKANKSDVYTKEEVDGKLTVEVINNNGHAYVDLGLPSGTLWATMNVGATEETGYGNYYQYGKGAAQYAETSGDSDYAGTEDPLDLSVDTARQVWGGSWHMPTKTQIEELIANTTYQWVTDYQGSGINGGLFTAQNGHVLFLPAAGCYDSGSLNGVGDYGLVWSSSPDDSFSAYYWVFYDGYENVSPDYRNYGHPVRGVIEPSRAEKYATKTELEGKQDTLVSGTNIKTVNNTSLLGSGNIDTSEVFVATYGTTTYQEVVDAYTAGKLPILIWGQSIFVFETYTATTVKFFSVSQSDNILKCVLLYASNNSYSLKTSLIQISNLVTSFGSTPSDSKYPSEKLVYDSLYKRGVISQTQTWTQAADGGYDYVMSDLVYGDIPRANIDLYEAAGAVFNEQSGYFELNGLTDISYEEMQDIYSYTISLRGGRGRVLSYALSSMPIRTSLPIRRPNSLIGVSFDGLLYPPMKIETIGFEQNIATNSVTMGSDLQDSFRAGYLREVTSVMDFSQTTAANRCFNDCRSLQTVFIHSLKISLSFYNSSRLSVASILYMINNEAATSAITITLHATAYARAIADTDIQTALQNHPNVTLASAT